MRRAKVRINTKIEIKALLGHGTSQRHVATALDVFKKNVFKMCQKSSRTICLV